MNDGSAPVRAGGAPGGGGRAPQDDGADRGPRSAPARDVPAVAMTARDRALDGARGTFAEALARMRSGKVAAASLGHGPAAGSRQGQPPAPAGAKASGPSGTGSARTLPAHRRATDETRLRKEDDPLDPSARRAAQLAPPPQTSVAAATIAQAPPPPAPPARTSLEALLPSLVKRIAWSGDARRGTVRLELGAGALAGATLLIESTDGRIDVQIAAPAGVDAAAWRERIARRLGERGLDVGSVVVE